MLIVPARATEELPINYFETLPNEVLNYICARMNKETLKSFRLVARRCRAPASKYLYETFVLWRTKTSWKHLGLIVGTPELVNLVKRIKIARVDLFPLPMPKEEWVKASIDGQGSAVEGIWCSNTECYRRSNSGGGGKHAWSL